MERLGVGAYGEVYRAYDHNLGREVALKLYRDRTSIDEAVYEAHKLTEVRGPNILPVVNADKYNDIPYIATELAVGGTVADATPATGVSPILAVRWVRHLLVGLGVCHRHNLLHRDIRLSNVFLRSADEALLGDFGVAGEMDSLGRTPPHGFPSIRAPEAYTAGFLTVASDIYSAGHALYHLLTGSDPFLRSTPNEMVEAVRAQTLARVRDAAPHVPRTLAMRVERAMSTDPWKRFQSAGEFHDGLADVVAIKIDWLRIAAHPGHYACWYGRHLLGGMDMGLCVTRSDNSFEIETRKAGGTRRRVARGCKWVRDDRQLRISLRDIFDHSQGK